MTIADFDHLDVAGRRRLLKQCCNSDVWVKKMLAIFPIQNLVDLLEYAEEEWYECNPAEWLEAFQSHIRIGDIGSIENNITINADWVKILPILSTVANIAKQSMYCCKIKICEQYGTLIIMFILNY